MTQKILIVDDDQSFRAFERGALERKGYQVTEAEDGIQALSFLRAETFDMVLLDIFMPNQEGIETLRKIRKSDSEIPVITISGGGAIHNYLPLRTAELMGANMTLEKPVTMRTLLKAVDQNLNHAA